jgi:hypothetical protein
LIKYTYAGDASLDGTVDTIDFNLLAANFSAVRRIWYQGDFNYDNTVDTIDFNLLASNFGLVIAADTLLPGAGELAPEPLFAGPVILGLILARPRRSASSGHTPCRQRAVAVPAATAGNP